MKRTAHPFRHCITQGSSPTQAPTALILQYTVAHLQGTSLADAAMKQGRTQVWFPCPSSDLQLGAATADVERQDS
jgi:hypothetical protein